MESVQDISVIGIDGGGSCCRFALRHQGRDFVVHGGSANASSDRTSTLATLQKGLADLATKAGLGLADLQHFPTFAGLAGVVDVEGAKQLGQSLPLTNVHIEDDRRTAMVGALGDHNGCVIGIGTGSFFGRRADGVDRIIGGWGLVLGDEASGAYLGRRLLSHIVNAQDGTCTPSPLTQETFAHFGSVAAIVAFAATAKPAEFAQHAPHIVAAAQRGDPVAVALVSEGARHIEKMLNHLGWQPGERICPHGGLATYYALYLAPNVAAHWTKPEGTALDGALRLAAQMATVGETA